MKPKQTKVPTLGAKPKSAEALSLEAQLQAKRMKELELFKEEAKALIEKYGYEFSPVITITSQKVLPSLEIVPIR